VIVFHSSVRAFDLVSHIGIAICEYQFEDHEYGRHCGILYKLDDQAPRLLHLAWHRDLRDDEPDPKYLWGDVGLEASNRRFLAAWAGNQRINKQNIPYGLDSSGSCFDPDTGEFIPPPIGKGLTCSTYITAAFRQLGIELLQQATWPNRPEDVAFGQRIVDGLIADRERDPTSVRQEHIKGVRNDVGARRFRPVEVVGASTRTFAEWPIAFADARAAADQILQDLEAARDM
jgi:hypothetical protein